jgi:hypothetical protein
MKLTDLGVSTVLDTITIIIPLFSVPIQRYQWIFKYVDMPSKNSKRNSMSLYSLDIFA